LAEPVQVQVQVQVQGGWLKVRQEAKRSQKKLFVYFGSFNASYSFGGAQRDGPFAYRAHAND
jgi:hypothetical protein